MTLLPPEFLSALAMHFNAEDYRCDPADCWVYGYDNSRRHALPQAVVFAQNEQQIQTLVKLCYQYEVPLVARGLGSGTPGGAVPIQGGVVLSFERMARIIELDVANRLMVVEPGITNQAVQEAAKQAGFFWPPDPTSSAYCTIGGNLSYNSAGPRAVKYGTPRENTLGLHAITGEGELIKTGVYTTKGVVGYDLTRLIIGSEGTLAIIIQATLKLTPLPPIKRTLQALYTDIHSATQAVIALMSQPIIPCAIEFMDHTAIQLVQSYSSLPIPEQTQALLMIEVDGDEASIDNTYNTICKIANREGCLLIRQATTAKEIAELWQMRKSLSPALRTLAPKKINEDVVVPIANLGYLVEGSMALAKKHDITIVNFGHAGNGNIHVNLLVDSDNPQEMERAHHCLHAIFDLVLSLNGTLSGEHGIGLEKQPFIRKELSESVISLMQKIKTQFDPKNILNPGKIW